MRILLLLRGSAGCGKTTWIEQNNLTQYTLSADTIRLMYQSPILRADGTEGISASNDSTVWKTLFRILEERMKKGEFTVIDATNSRTSEMNRYKDLCETYKYRIYCVDFTDIPIEETKRRNINRDSYKIVSEKAIDTMYARFATQKIPSGIKVITPEELDTVWLKKIDLSGYKKIHHIGDIHGCYTALQTYFDNNGGIKDDEMYIFVGDYIDRGLEHAKVINFLLSIMNRKNVLMLEGNHDRHLWSWANEQIASSKEFELITKPDLEETSLNKKDVRKLYRKFGQCAYYQYGPNTYIVTHAGLSKLPENLSLVSTHLLINGAGEYEEVQKVADTFYETTDENCFQIFGHRNTKQLPIKVNDRVFNLEGQVEYGGHLRCVQVDAEGIHTFEIKNDIYKIPEALLEESVVKSSIADTIIALRHDKFISEKKFGNISSFTYTDQAFYDKVWNAQTIQARGLYLDTVKGKVTARSYNKFFNIGERRETKLDMLQQKLRFPVTAYVKENGFLGIVSYDEYEDDLWIASKSTKEGSYARWLSDMLHKEVSSEKLENLKEYCKTQGVSFVFECVDMEHDPHIISYTKNRLFLLDVVYNQMDFAKYKYEDMCELAGQFELEHKEKAYEIESWQEFFDWYYEVLEEDYEYNGCKIEGFVIEDSAGYMTKLKLDYYNFWKTMRSIAHDVYKRGCISNTAVLTTPVANEFYAWLKEKYEAGDMDSLPKDICNLRNLFYNTRNCASTVEVSHQELHRNSCKSGCRA